jgi:hypothetical protein
MYLNEYLGRAKMRATAEPWNLWIFPVQFSLHICEIFDNRPMSKPEIQVLRFLRIDRPQNSAD